MVKDTSNRFVINPGYSDLFNRSIFPSPSSCDLHKFCVDVLSLNIQALAQGHCNHYQQCLSIHSCTKGSIGIIWPTKSDRILTEVDRTTGLLSRGAPFRENDVMIVDLSDPDDANLRHSLKKKNNHKQRKDVASTSTMIEIFATDSMHSKWNSCDYNLKKGRHNTKFEVRL
ncbi:uncharacterized protein FA14DRAFT_157796 [Meira miltonrushii]|uniref:Uncharacterized protein n=1 Tax=Meira miltonrushii TaxID=1280837 RepID=A0A316VAB1_9BASI|nr:uncharacterized protein FA14DRAFT_157796 [Meira miltonrushii]PWN33113.1 hypothetical protein FA14DRAFT_157796 [Meira miltonrushii]